MTEGKAWTKPLGVFFRTLLIAAVTVTVPLVWSACELSKTLHESRRMEAYTRKEESYKALLQSASGFYLESYDPSKIRDFVHEIDQCWLYCPDDVILQIYRFIGTVRTAEVDTTITRELAFGNMVAAIRQDLIAQKPLTHSALTGADYQHLGTKK